MEKNKKSFNIFLTVLKILLLTTLLILTYLIIQNTSSKYLTQEKNSEKYSILGWNIKVNNEDLVSNEVIDFTEHVLVNYENVEDIVDGKIAPTSKASFELTIDSTGTELPYKYVLTFLDEDYEEKMATDDSYNYIPDFKITSYTINEGTPTIIKAGATEIEGVVIPDLDDEGHITNSNAINKFTITIEWYDGEDNIFDNKQDVSVAKRYNEDGTAVIPATIPLDLTITQINPDDDTSDYYNTITALRNTNTTP